MAGCPDLIFRLFYSVPKAVRFTRHRRINEFMYSLSPITTLKRSLRAKGDESGTEKHKRPLISGLYRGGELERVGGKDGGYSRPGGAKPA